MNRRTMIGTGVAALAGLSAAHPVGAQDDDAAVLIAGGGAVETLLGLVDFGVVATRATDDTVAGSFNLTDFTQPGNPTVMQSTQLNRLERFAEEGTRGYQLTGWVSAAGESALFVLRVTDRGIPGAGEDQFALYAGEAAAPFFEDEEAGACACATWSWHVEGAVVHGDILVIEPRQ